MLTEYEALLLQRLLYLGYEPFGYRHRERRVAVGTHRMVVVLAAHTPLPHLFAIVVDACLYPAQGRQERQLAVQCGLVQSRLVRT